VGCSHRTERSHPHCSRSHCHPQTRICCMMSSACQSLSGRRSWSSELLRNCLAWWRLMLDPPILSRGKLVMLYYAYGRQSLGDESVRETCRMSLYGTLYIVIRERPHRLALFALNGHCAKGRCGAIAGLPEIRSRMVSAQLPSSTYPHALLITSYDVPCLPTLHTESRNLYCRSGRDNGIQPSRLIQVALDPCSLDGVCSGSLSFPLDYHL
jgi:hypothetical protein